MTARQDATRVIGWKLHPANGGNFVYLPVSEGYYECQDRQGRPRVRARNGMLCGKPTDHVERIYA